MHPRVINQLGIHSGKDSTFRKNHSGYWCTNAELYSVSFRANCRNGGSFFKRVIDGYELFTNQVLFALLSRNIVKRAYNARDGGCCVTEKL